MGRFRFDRPQRGESFANDGASVPRLASHTVQRFGIAMADVVIRNGTVVDGTGESEPYVADVAFKDGARHIFARSSSPDPSPTCSSPRCSSPSCSSPERPRSAAGKISAVGPSLAVTGAEEVDATGMLVTPGFVDIHSHFVRVNRPSVFCCAVGSR